MKLSALLKFSFIIFLFASNTFGVIGSTLLLDLEPVLEHNHFSSIHMKREKESFKVEDKDGIATLAIAYYGITQWTQKKDLDNVVESWESAGPVFLRSMAYAAPRVEGYKEDISSIHPTLASVQAWDSVPTYGKMSKTIGTWLEENGQYFSYTVKIKDADGTDADGIPKVLCPLLNVAAAPPFVFTFLDSRSLNLENDSWKSESPSDLQGNFSELFRSFEIEAKKKEELLKLMGTV